MSAILNTKRAVERLVAGLGYPVAYEEVAFDPPANAVWLRLNFRVNEPESPTMGEGYYREDITAFIFVAGPKGKGTAQVITVAEQIRTLLDKGSTLIESGTEILVLKKPQIAGTAPTDSHVVCPVIVDFSVNVYE